MRAGEHVGGCGLVSGLVIRGNVDVEYGDNRCLLLYNHKSLDQLLTASEIYVSHDSSFV